MSVRCLLIFPRGDYYGGPTYREMPPIDLAVVPRADECIILDSEGDEWWVTSVGHAPGHPTDPPVWLFLRRDRYPLGGGAR